MMAMTSKGGSISAGTISPTDTTRGPNVSADRPHLVLQMSPVRRPGRLVVACRPVEQELDLGQLEAVVGEDGGGVGVGEAVLLRRRSSRRRAVRSRRIPASAAAATRSAKREPGRRHRLRPGEREVAADEIVRSRVAMAASRRSRLGDGGDEALELAQVAALVDAVAVGGVVGDDRVAGVPVAAGSGLSQYTWRARLRSDWSTQLCDAW